MDLICKQLKQENFSYVWKFVDDTFTKDDKEFTKDAATKVLTDVNNTAHFEAFCFYLAVAPEFDRIKKDLITGDIYRQNDLSRMEKEYPVIKEYNNVFSLQTMIDSMWYIMTHPVLYEYIKLYRDGGDPFYNILKVARGELDDEYWLDIYTTINQCILKAPVSNDKCILFRGEEISPTYNSLNKYNIGDVWQTTSFLSTSTQIYTAYQYSDRLCCIIIYLVPSMYPTMFIGFELGEVLLPEGTRLKLVNKTTYRHKTAFIVEIMV
jgi:hypothetical protein